MKSAKRFITACLTATMIFQALAPSTEILAQEVDAAGDAAVQAAFAFDGAVKGAKSRVAQLSADATNAVVADDGSTGSGVAGDAGTGSTGPGDTAPGEAEQPSDGEERKTVEKCPSDSNLRTVQIQLARKRHTLTAEAQKLVIAGF